MIDQDMLATRLPAFETRELRGSLKRFMNAEFLNEATGEATRIGGFEWGVYAFFDYDDEPIYVGQTKEQISGRVGRHLTGQRSDAVAKSVLDPLEVRDIEVWPLPQFQGISKRTDPEGFRRAARHLDALEHAVHQKLISESRFGVILNEKDPPKPDAPVTPPRSMRGRIVSDDVLKIRSHPDFRLHRRATVIARLSQGIAERDVKVDLRRVLLVQAKRLQWLAEQRYLALGGDARAECGHGGDDDAQD